MDTGVLPQSVMLDNLKKQNKKNQLKIINPLGTMNVCLKFHGNPPRSS